MQYLKQYKESQLIFLDIKTVRAVDKLEPGPLEDAWNYKARYQNEVDLKTGERLTNQQYFHEKAALYAPFARVACIVAGRISDKQLKTKPYTGTERDLLLEFNSDLSKYDDPVLCGFNIVGFDMPFLVKRMLACDVVPCSALDTAHLKPWEVRAVDLSRLWQGSSYYPDSLVAVATALGLSSPKSQMTGAEVSDAFYAGRVNEIVDYCTADVRTVANMYRKFMHKPLL